MKVTTSEFSAKFRSKNEVYTFLAVDVDACLPPTECVTIYFLKELVSGKKKCKSIIKIMLCQKLSRLAKSKSFTSHSTRNWLFPKYFKKARKILVWWSTYPIKETCIVCQGTTSSTLRTLLLANQSRTSWVKVLESAMIKLPKTET